MEPIPEVEAVARELNEVLGGDDLLLSLRHASGVAVRVLPSCVGVSITVILDHEPFTVTAVSDEIRALDAVQYLEDGPCVASAADGEVVRVDDVLDEGRWQLFAAATAARGVRSTLSIPLRRPGGLVSGALNLYASEPHAFAAPDALVEELFGGPVAGVVANADLSFLTRERARALPQQLADRARIDQAVGVLIGRSGGSPQQARNRLLRAADQAGITAAEAADTVISLDT